MMKKWVYIGILLVLASCEENNSHPLYIESGGLIDAEGNSYKTVVIGDQEWMAENLKTDLYCNGDSIHYQDPDIRVKTYDNDPANEEIFGKLYNYQAVLDTSGLCPCGWHVPTELEYAVLIDYLGGYFEAMKKMKASGSIEHGTGLWTNPENNYVLSGTNSSGFSALPAGTGHTYEFNRKDSMTSFWSLPTDGSDAIQYGINIGIPYVEKQRYTLPNLKTGYYLSVRCMKDL